MSDLSYCAQQLRQFDRERFLCLMFAPPERREALFALHAFDLELALIPERVTEHLLGQMRFQWWRDAIEQTYAGNPPHHEVLQPLSEAIAAYGLERAAFDRLIDTRERDLDAWPNLDRAALAEYLDGTASTLAGLAMSILGITDSALALAARRATRAWAMMRLLRDMPRHAGSGRVFLPEQACRGARIECADLLLDQAGRELGALAQAFASKAERDLREAHRAGRGIPSEAMATLLPAVLARRQLNRFRKVCRGDPLHPAMRRPSPLTVLDLWIHARLGRI